MHPRVDAARILAIHRPGSVQRGLIERIVRKGGEGRLLAEVIRQISFSQLLSNAVALRICAGTGPWGQRFGHIADARVFGKHRRLVPPLLPAIW